MLRLFLALALVTAAPALAEKAEAAALAKEAERFYQAFQYREAAEKLREAYAVEPLPRYLYNIARAWDQAGELERSLDAYREYTALPAKQTEPDLVKKANLAMDRLRTLVARQKAEAERQESEKAKLQEEARRAEERAEAEAAEARRQRREAEAREKARLEKEAADINVRKVAAFATGGVALAALGTSLVTGIAAASNRGEFGRAATLADKQRLQTETQVTAGICDVAALVGLAAGVTAIILYPKGGSDGAVSVMVAPLSGGAFAGVGGRF